MSTEADPAQEFGERLAKRWWDAYGLAWGRCIPPMHEQQLATLIANELRAGGWQKGGAPQGVDMARATFT